MRRILVLAVVAIMALFAYGNADAQNKKQSSVTKEISFDVALHCQNCVKKVEANLPFEKGVKDLKVSLDTHTVWIQYDAAKTDVEKLKAAIKKLGYEAKEKK